MKLSAIAFTLLGASSLVAANDCALPGNAKDFALVTRGDADVGAHNIYRGVAIGGTLTDTTPSESGTVDQTKSYINVCNQCNFNFNGGVSYGANTVADDMFARMSYLATHAEDYESNGFKVVVLNHGGIFNTYNFRPGGQGEDNGKTLVIFNTSEDVILKRTDDGRQWGPSVIAPFSKVRTK